MELGWRVGFGLTAYDSSSDPTPLDDTIGKLAVYQKEWGNVDEQGNSKPTEMRPLKTRPCTRADINFEGSKDSTALFYKPSEEYVADLERFFDKLVCIED